MEMLAFPDTKDGRQNSGDLFNFYQEFSRKVWSDQCLRVLEDAKRQGYNSASRNLWGIQIAHLSCLRGVWFRSLTSLKDSVKKSRCPLKCRFSVGSQPYQQPMRLSRWGELPAASQRASGVGPILAPTWAMWGRSTLQLWVASLDIGWG